MFNFFDTHCHFPHAKYKKSSEEIVQNAKSAGVDLLMNIGTSLKENRRAIETVNQFENVFCSIGIYPHDDHDLSLEELKYKLEDFLKQSPKIKAIGEIGVDRPLSEVSGWQGGRSLNEQLELFEMQIILALKHKLPIVIHNRNGDKEILEMVGKYSKQGLSGVCHCFVQDWEYAEKMLDFGFYLAFGGVITYSSGGYLAEVIKKMPKDRILAETDSPYLLPEPLRSEKRKRLQDQTGEANEPKNVAWVVQKIAEFCGLSYDEVAKFTRENGKRAFGI